ncbi:OmpA family protein [Parasalinivibrio latis]|uniref:OmpA family protein n=1 Tax=Parasalinivibrio latis TaxID=2952610 RepID=UPI0030E542C5
MKRTLIGLSILLMAGCSNQEIVTMPTSGSITPALQDQDGDGVITAREQCPETLEGAWVNNDGCGNQKPVEKRIHLNVRFANDSSVVAQQFYKDIAKVADFLKSHPHTQVVIEGHASAVGRSEHNMTLSQSRADAIANVLVDKFHIAADRVTAKGFGETRLLDTANTPEADAKNRRVIADVTGSEDVTDMIWTIYSVD